MKLPKLAKSVKVDKAESKQMMTLSITIAVAVFCLVGSKQLFSQASYRHKVINAKQAAAEQLTKNATTASSLIQRYQIFNTTNPNIIGGQNTTDPNAVPPNGDNGRIVLDALPSKYDFPALISSVYKLMANDGIDTPSVDASDQSSIVSQPPSPTPSPVSIPISMSGAGSYSAVLAFIKDLEKSVRPFDVTDIQLSGSNTHMTFTLQATTYYQPAKTVGTTTKEIK